MWYHRYWPAIGHCPQDIKHHFNCLSRQRDGDFGATLYMDCDILIGLGYGHELFSRLFRNDSFSLVRSYRLIRLIEKS